MPTQSKIIKKASSYMKRIEGLKYIVSSSIHNFIVSLVDLLLLPTLENLCLKI